MADFAAIAVPALIITGDRDMFCSVEEASVAYRGLTTGELSIVPNTGHEITPSVIDAMIDFGARYSPAA